MTFQLREERQKTGRGPVFKIRSMFHGCCENGGLQGLSEFAGFELPKEVVGSRITVREDMKMQHVPGKLTLIALKVSTSEQVQKSVPLCSPIGVLLKVNPTVKSV